MIIEAIIFSLIIGLIRGGKIRKLGRINKKSIWLLILGVAIQYILMFLTNGSIALGEAFLKRSNGIMLASYILILIGLVGSLNFKSLWLTLVGFFLNFFVYALNSFRIPVLTHGLSLINRDGLINTIENSAYLYVPITENTKYPVLGNIIVFSKPYPIPKLLSVGDLIIAFSIFSLIQELMLTDDSFMGGYRL